MPQTLPIFSERVTSALSADFVTIPTFSLQSARYLNTCFMNRIMLLVSQNFDWKCKNLYSNKKTFKKDT